MPCAYGHQDAYELTSIYSLFDESGRLLYIGKTKNLTRRYKEHITTQPWKSEIAFVRIETVYCVKCAANIELRRIRQEQPPYNIVATVRAAIRLRESSGCKAASEMIAWRRL